eukprot:3403467-Heterocapsa_arctica.AAC.1
MGSPAFRAPVAGTIVANGGGRDQRERDDRRGAPHADCAPERHGHGSCSGRAAPRVRAGGRRTAGQFRHLHRLPASHAPPTPREWMLA